MTPNGGQNNSSRSRSGGAVVTLVLSVLAFLLVVGFMLTQQEVTVLADGRTIPLRTHQLKVNGVLDSAGVKLLPGDQVEPAQDTSLEDGMEITVQRAQVVTVDLDGRLLTRRTQAADVAELFDELEIFLAPTDQVIADGVQIWPTVDGEFSVSSLPKRITVNRSIPYFLDDNGVSISLETSKLTVGRAIQEAGVTLYLGDDVRPPLHTPITAGIEVSIRRSVPVSVELDGETIHTRTHRGTVGELLAELGVVLIGQDYSLPNLDEQLTTDTTVHVVRVLEEILTEQEAISYESAWQPDANLEIDHQRVAQDGAPGVLQRRIRVRYEDGQEVSRVLEDEWVAQEPTTHIIAYGTQIVIRTLDTPDGPIEYWRTIRMLATSYTAATSGKEQSHPAYGVTAVGWEMRKGIVAVDPRLVNLFQEVYVPGYGFAVAADTGGAIKGRRIDLGYDENNLVLWYNWIDLYLLAPAPEPSKIRYIIGD
jgi:uncharacterized protein YabE (DUF348 family)